MIKPQQLSKGDTIAIVTLSWGGPSAFPKKFEQGIHELEKLGFRVVCTPHARKSAEWLLKNPRKRLDDFVWAHEQKQVKAIMSSIGGEESIRLLSLITAKDEEIIRKNPKIFVGMSDTTTINFLLYRLGIVSFYGPSVLFGMAENGGVHPFTQEYFEKALTTTTPAGLINNPKNGWSCDRVSWDDLHTKKKYQSSFKQQFYGKNVHKGTLIGGCAELLELLKATSFWPNKWNDKILFIETSELRPDPTQFALWLRSYAEMGILQELQGLLVGIPGGDVPITDEEYHKKCKQQAELTSIYEKKLQEVLNEYGCSSLPVVTRLSFGHTTPMITIPIGVQAQIDTTKKKVEIIEAGVK